MVEIEQEFKNRESTLPIIWKKFKHLTLILCFTLLYLLSVPLFLLLFSPIYIFRLLASQLRKILRPDLDKLVNTRSVVLAVDGFPTKPRWNLVVWLTQGGILDLDKFRQDFYTEYIQKRSSSRKLVYPEYQQYLDKWLDFYFWKWDSEFDIRHHIRSYDGVHANLKEIITDEILLQIIQELTWAPWNPKRSPWEFLQISNYQTKGQSILIFRINHVIGDGYFVLKLLMEDICGINLKKAAQPKPPNKKTIFKRILDNSLFWIRGPYQFVQMMVDSYDNNPWHQQYDESKERKFSYALTPQIRLSYIKQVKDLHGVSFTAVIMAAVAGGIRSTMLEQGIRNPKDIHQAVPVPLPGHPLKLRNHFICSFLKLPVGTADPLQRLMKMERILQNLKNSSVPLLNFYKVPLIGGLFPAWMAPFTTNYHTTCIMSNFPGTPDIPNFKGVNVVDMMFGVGLGPGNAGLGFTLISYLDNIRMLTVVDQNIVGINSKVEELNDRIIREIGVLNDLGNI